MKILSRIFTVFLLLTFLPGTQAEPSLNFLAMGDSGSGTRMQIDVAEAMAHYAGENQNSQPVSFVLVLGDNFYQKGVSSVRDPQWQQKFEQMYDKSRLPMPFLAVLGNHDGPRNFQDVQIDYARIFPESRWKMDGHWYKRHFLIDPTDLKTGVDFFFLDSGLWDAADNTMGEKQMAWLTDELKNSTALWKFVATHKPVYSNGHHGRDSDILALRKRLAPLLTQYKVDAYFSGHDHDLQRIQVPEIPTLFLISGAAGKLRPKQFDDWKPFYESSSGFLAVRLSANQMRGEFIDAKGKIIDVWHRPPQLKTLR